MNIKLLNYIGLDFLYNPRYGVPMGLSCSFLRKIQKTSKNPSNIPDLTVTPGGNSIQESVVGTCVTPGEYRIQESVVGTIVTPGGYRIQESVVGT